MTTYKYIFDGPYREFRGHVFVHGKPTTITDSGTLEAVRRDPTFKEWKDEIEARPARRPILHARGR